MTTNHFIFSTRLGDAAVIYRDTPFSITETLLPCRSAKTLREKITRKNGGAPGFHPNASTVSNTISDYIAGKTGRIPPPWHWMSLEGLTELQVRVLAATARIPFGETGTYKSIALSIGHPRAYRFVGTTLANNPFPLLVPCHCVIRSDGSIGQFGGGPALKRELLRIEENPPPAARCPGN